MIEIKGDSKIFIKLFQKARWKNGIKCPKCGNEAVEKRKKDKEGKQFYYCPVCRRNKKNPYFHDLSGTPFQNKKIPIEKIINLQYNFYLALN